MLLPHPTPKSTEELYQQNASNKLKTRSEKFQYPENGHPTRSDQTGQDARCAPQERWELSDEGLHLPGPDRPLLANLWPLCPPVENAKD